MTRELVLLAISGAVLIFAGVALCRARGALHQAGACYRQAAEYYRQADATLLAIYGASREVDEQLARLQEWTVRR